MARSPRTTDRAWRRWSQLDPQLQPDSPNLVPEVRVRAQTDDMPAQKRGGVS